jgi:hypothetical protein
LHQQRTEPAPLVRRQQRDSQLRRSPVDVREADAGREQSHPARADIRLPKLTDDATS